MIQMNDIADKAGLAAGAGLAGAALAGTVQAVERAAGVSDLQANPTSGDGTDQGRSNKPTSNPNKSSDQVINSRKVVNQWPLLQESLSDLF